MAEGPYAGVGRDNPNRNPAIAGFTSTDAERDDLIAFLESLTDDAFLHGPRFQDPFTPRR